jgi:hypothetical protein
MTRTTTHHLTNGETNFTFRITGETALVITMAAHAWATPKCQAMTTEAARKHFGLAKKFGCTAGRTRFQGLRRITTDAQFAAYTEANFDFDNNENDPEAHLALEQEFAEVGYLEVVA